MYKKITMILFNAITFPLLLQELSSSSRDVTFIDVSDFSTLEAAK